MTFRYIASAALFFALFFASNQAEAARLKDIASLDGVRINRLIGFGLVGGLAGTGDDPKSAVYTAAAIAGMLSQFGFQVDPASIKVKNFAAVAVTADFPAYYRGGDKLDVTVSSIGSAKSLEGGILYRTILTADDGEIYAVAQGPVSLGDFIGGGAGEAGGRQKRNTTVGRVVGGAIVEREVPSTVLKEDGTIRYNLHQPDFTTAQNIALRIEELLGRDSASALDGGTIAVRVPAAFANDLVPFVSVLESLDIETDAVAKVVINQRTGTIVMGGDVGIKPVAVAHGSLSISVGNDGDVDAGSGSERRSEALIRVNAGDVVAGLNALGAKPQDIVAIFEAMAAAGALEGVLEVI
ncbi:MAG: flagellar basal body P-ring protein FlgI [bacterium]|jgi:flagellar P-ring protein precursor FlgI